MNPDKEINDLETKLQQALTEYVVGGTVEGESIKLDRLEQALLSLKAIHNKLIDKATDILAKRKV